MKKLNIVFVMLFLLLTGCSFSAGIDTLIVPPKLSRQQEHIYNALEKYAGNNISLKYPKSGDYLSAFIIADIDGDDDDEAIVFYEKNAVSSEDTSLRMNILDCIDSSWRSVYDHATNGNEVEKVLITPLGDNGRINIIVGYSLINESEKVVSIYHYEDSKLTTTFENNYYSLFDTADLNGDGSKELLVALGQSPSREACVQVYHLSEGGEYLKSDIELIGEGCTDYQKVSYGTLEDGRMGIYLDAVIGVGTIVTSVFSVDENNVLSRVFTPDIEKGVAVRPAAYTCCDVDEDGVIEIPVPELFPGYTPEDSGALSLTKWCELRDGKIAVEYCGYRSITNAYSLVFPDNWIDSVTAYTSAERDCLYICEYTGKVPQEEMPFVLLKTVSGSDTEKVKSLCENGYEILQSRGDKVFMIYMDEQHELTGVPEELMLKFIFDEM